MQSEFLGQLSPYLTSLALGLLIGMERERSPAAKAGLRTFSLVALSGTLGAMLSERTDAPWMLGAGLLVMGGMMVATYFKSEQGEDPGTTTVAAVVVCYALGAMVWHDMEQLAVTLAILTTALLYFKAELRGVTSNLNRRDLVSMLQFAVLSLVILPILPDSNFGPFNVLNPYQLWWMVVLISGLSLAGYAALRIAGQRHGSVLTGMFGGLASSTATTLAFARHARDTPGLIGAASLVILLANSVVLFRLAVVVALLAPALIQPILWVFSGGAIAGLLVIYLHWRKLTHSSEAPILEIKNPTEIPTALSFGAFYALVLLASAWVGEQLGSQGVYIVALVSGFTDVDAITLSSLRLFGLGNLEGAQAINAILIAVLANLAFKAGLCAVVGGAGLARQALPGMAALAMGLVLGWLALAYG